jgi:hypothetical protein
MEIINETKDRLNKIIKESSLSEEQKTMWFDFIGTSSSDNLKPIEEMLAEDGTMLTFLTKNLEDKINLANSGNHSDRKKIIEEEKEYVEELED